MSHARGRAEGWRLHLPLARLFLIFSVSAGLLFAVLVPPNQVPDEHLHIASVYGILQGHPASKYAAVPATLSSILAKYHDADLPGMTINIRTYLAEFGLRSSSLSPTPAYTLQYSPLLYIPQIVGVAVGTLLSLPDLFIILLGRVMSLLLYGILGYVLIRRMPAARTSFFVVLTIPMAVFLAGSFSADTWSNCVSFVYIILVILAMRTEEVLSRPQKAWLLAFAILLGLAKPVYWSIIPLSWAIPTGRFRDNREKTSFVLRQLGLGVLGAFLWLRIAFKDPRPFAFSYIHPGQQLAYVLLNPLAFARALVATLGTSWQDWLYGLVGKFGWYRVYMPDFAYALFLVAVVCAIVADRKTAVLMTGSQRAIFLSVGLAYVAANLTAVYLSWDPVGSPLIAGFQGRYLIPIMPLLFFVVASYGARTSARVATAAETAVACIMPVMLFFSVQTIYLTYFAPCGDYFYAVQGECVLPTTAEVPHQPSGELLKPITQSFTPACSPIAGVEILLSTYGRVNTGDLVVTLTKEAGGAPVFGQKLGVAELADNSWQSVRFAPIDIGVGDRLSLMLAPEGSSPGNAITAWVTNSEEYDQGQLTGVDAGGHLEFRYICPYGIVHEVAGVAP